MKEQTTLKLKMFDSVNSVMNKHLPVWSHIDELTKTNDIFVRNYKKMVELTLEAENSLDKLQEEYMNKRKQLIDEMFPLADVISIYLADNNLKKDKKLFMIKADKLSKQKNMKLRKMADAIIKLSRNNQTKRKKNRPDISMYGLTDERIDKIRMFSDDLSDAEKQYKSAFQTKKQARRKIQKLISENNKLLKIRMDTFIRLFQADHSAFFNDYMNARVIIKPVNERAVNEKPVNEKPVNEKPVNEKPVKRKSTKKAADNTPKAARKRVAPARKSSAEQKVKETAQKTDKKRGRTIKESDPQDDRKIEIAPQKPTASGNEEGESSKLRRKA